MMNSELLAHDADDRDQANERVQVEKATDGEATVQKDIHRVTPPSRAHGPSLLAFALAFARDSLASRAFLFSFSMADSFDSSVATCWRRAPLV